MKRYQNNTVYKFSLTHTCTHTHIHIHTQRHTHKDTYTHILDMLLYLNRNYLKLFMPTITLCLSFCILCLGIFIPVMHIMYQTLYIFIIYIYMIILDFYQVFCLTGWLETICTFNFTRLCYVVVQIISLSCDNNDTSRLFLYGVIAVILYYLRL